MSKKRYPDEFKIEAVKQVVDCGHSVAALAGYLGMTTHSLYAWIKKFGPDFAKHNAMSDEQAESPNGQYGLFVTCLMFIPAAITHE